MCIGDRSGLHITTPGQCDDVSSPILPPRNVTPPIFRTSVRQEEEHKRGRIRRTASVHYVPDGHHVTGMGVRPTQLLSQELANLGFLSRKLLQFQDISGHLSPGGTQFPDLHPQCRRRMGYPYARKRCIPSRNLESICNR